MTDDCFAGGTFCQQKTQVEACLFENEEVRQSMYVQQESMEVKAPSGKSYDIYLFVPEEPDRLDSFITFRTRKGHKQLSLSQEGVILTEKAAIFLGVEEGDSIAINTADHHSYTVPVSAITEHYTNHYLYMTPQAYEQVFGQTPSYNMVQSILVEPGGEAQTLLSQNLIASDGVLAGIRYFYDQRSVQRHDPQYDLCHVGVDCFCWRVGVCRTV